MGESKNPEQNLDNSNEMGDVVNSILSELEELKSMYKRWDDDEDSFTSMSGVYRHKASGIEDSIKIVKKRKRDNNINEALRYHGLSVIIRTEEEFNHIKKFLGEDVLWMNWVPQISTKLTGIIIWVNHEHYTPGSVGCAESQREQFIRLVEFNDFFKV